MLADILSLSMNYGLQLSLKLEKYLAQLEAEGAEDDEDECLEDRAMKMAQQEMFEETGNRWKPWCANGKSIRVGEIILIIDADTIIPEVSAFPIVAFWLWLGGRVVWWGCACLF